MRKWTEQEYIAGIKTLRNREHGEHALVIGNSPWRRGFPIEAWFGPTIACNAFYRDADKWPTYLCAYDSDMIDECVRERTFLETTLILRADETRTHVLAEIPMKEWHHWFALADAEFDFGGTCGSLAIGLAGWLGCASVTLLGFSMSHDNIYQGSPHYRQDVTSEAHSRAGSRGTDREFIIKALQHYHRLSPKGSVHWISPADWMLGALANDGAAVATITGNP